MSTQFVQSSYDVRTMQNSKSFCHNGLRRTKKVRNLYGMTTNTEVTAKQLRDLAAKFRAIFEGYSGVADEMENANVASIEARGLPTLNVTITRALGNVNTMRRAILRAQVDAATQPVSESAPRPKKASEAKRKNT